MVAMVRKIFTMLTIIYCHYHIVLLYHKTVIDKDFWAGLSYTLDYADAKQPQDEVVNQDGATVFIDKKAQLSILGTEMDFQESK